MRLFNLQRFEDESGVSGVGLVAQGVEFDNGWCALTWLTQHTSVAFYVSLQEVEAIHGHNGKTTLEIVETTEPKAPSFPKLNDPDVQALLPQFLALKQRWGQETCFISSSTQITLNVNYLRIIALGKRVVPLILAEMEADPNLHWGCALLVLTDANPVPDEAMGKSDEVSAAWVAWGRQQGII